MQTELLLRRVEWIIRRQFLPGRDPRITSYNVCYTKLLRTEHQNLRSTDELDSLVEERILAFEPRLQIDEARVRLPGLLVQEEGHRRAPLALARQRPVGPVGDHASYNFV